MGLDHSKIRQVHSGGFKSAFECSWIVFRRKNISANSRFLSDRGSPLSLHFASTRVNFVIKGRHEPQQNGSWEKGKRDYNSTRRGTCDKWIDCRCMRYLQYL